MKIDLFALRREGEARDLRVVRERTHEYGGEHYKTPGQLVEMMQSVFDIRSLADERLYLILNGHGHYETAGVFELARGVFDFAYCTPKEVFSRALLLGASGIILVHNHPTLSTSPSKEDIDFEKRMKEAGEILGIPLRDFVIVGDGYYSFLEQGMM